MRPEDVRWFPHPHCRKPHALWSAPDSMASEGEVTAFVRALVRLTKPSLVVETGAYLGFTSMDIAEALSENGVGRLVTFEIDADTATVAAHNLRPFGNARVVASAVSAEHLSEPVEFAWIDSGMRSRQDDMNIIWPLLVPGGLALVHDASPLRPPGQVRPPGAFAMLDIPTPRGLNVFQKPWRAS